MPPVDPKYQDWHRTPLSEHETRSGSERSAEHNISFSPNRARCPNTNTNKTYHQQKAPNRTSNKRAWVNGFPNNNAEHEHLSHRSPNTNSEHDHQHRPEQQYRTCTLDAQHNTPSVEHKTSNTTQKHKTPNNEHPTRTLNAERRTPSTEHRTPSSEHRTPNTKHTAGIAKRLQQFRFYCLGTLEILGDCLHFVALHADYIINASVHPWMTLV